MDFWGTHHCPGPYQSAAKRVSEFPSHIFTLSLLSSFLPTHVCKGETVSSRLAVSGVSASGASRRLLEMWDLGRKNNFGEFRARQDWIQILSNPSPAL